MIGSEWLLPLVGERLFLDQGVAERKTEEGSECANVYKEYCSLERSFFPPCIPTYTHMLVCSSAPLKGLFHVLTLPFLSSLSRFSCFASTPFQQSFCLPCFSLSFLSWFSVQMSALSYLFARAQSNVLHPLFTSVSTKLPNQLCLSLHHPSPFSPLQIISSSSAPISIYHDTLLSLLTRGVPINRWINSYSYSPNIPILEYAI